MARPKWGLAHTLVVVVVAFALALVIVLATRPASVSYNTLSEITPESTCFLTINDKVRGIYLIQDVPCDAVTVTPKEE